MRAPYLRLFAMLLLVATAIGMLRPMVSYRALELGATPSQLGLITAAHGVLSLLVAIPAGRLVDRLGEPPFVLTGAGVIAGVSLGSVAASNLWALGMAQALLGAGQIICLIGAQSLVTQGASQEERDKRFGTFAIVVAFGQTAGPALAGLLAGPAEVSIVGVFLVAGGIGAGATLLALPLLLRPARIEPVTGAAGQDSFLPALRRIMRTPGIPPGMVVSLTLLASHDILIAYLPAYGEANDIPVATVTAMLAANGAVAMATRVMMVPLIRALGHRLLLICCLGCGAGGLLAVPQFDEPAPLFALMAATGIGIGLGNPLTLSWIAGHSPLGLRATTLGMRMSANRLGQVAIPAAIGVIGGAAGIGAVFVVTGLMVGASATVVGGSAFGREAS
ncbi:MFS transporter [Jiangella ureilytica]|uniref:MFS transporter n=1 Tax=Jiangella ureilytica TaxID=2530374 RepID=A0A4R4RRZ1_9ACTN|nr:MFS transporter [Jiangella ureilytica]TDC52771.1 MFS transporter [Jiangella ureilytica]